MKPLVRASSRRASLDWISLSALVLVSACSAAGGAGTPDQVVPAGGSGGENGGGGSSDGGSSGDVQGPEDMPVAEPEGDPNQLCGESAPGASTLRRLNRRELEQSIRDILPVGAEWSSVLSADTVSASGFDNDAGMLVVSKQTARELAETAESVAAAASGNLNTVLPCAGTPAPDAACAGTFLDTVGRRLFRRPLSASERTTYLGFFDTAFQATSDFAVSIGWLTRGLLKSPSFVYRREIGAVNGTTATLDQYEIATELAYTFSGTTPSDELLDAASRGELSSPEQLVARARELLLSPAGQGVVQTFFDAYVGHSRVTSIAKAGVEQFAAVREQMLEETRHFITEVIINRGGGVRELLTANFTTPTSALATFYGFPAPAADYAVLERPAGRGIGLLAQASVLATLAQPNGSSPTKRGLFVYRRLLCNDVPSVPANIPELGQPEPGVRTTRQRYEEDHAQGGCQNCHSRWDPIGFGFEHYDEAGRYRETEFNVPINSQSYVPEQVELSDRPDPMSPLFTFESQEELVTQLAEQPQVHQCLSGYVTTFAFGSALTCSGETQRAAFIAGEIGFIDYLASLAGEPHFTQRENEE